jgi:ribosome assembly protein RRB1
MSKRPAEDQFIPTETLKAGQRPIQDENGEDLEFEDDFEDEFESENEVFEAGVDGRPDEEREAEEKEGLRASQKSILLALC